MSIKTTITLRVTPEQLEQLRTLVHDEAELSDIAGDSDEAASLNDIADQLDRHSGTRAALRLVSVDGLLTSMATTPRRR